MMNPGISAALTASTAAAAEQQRLQQQEEEEMTSYSSQDLEDDWEFKILRSAYGAFRDPDHMAEVLEQESQAGWVLVEKFDHQRIRLKRRTSERRNDRPRSLPHHLRRTNAGARKKRAIRFAVC